MVVRQVLLALDDPVEVRVQQRRDQEKGPETGPGVRGGKVLVGGPGGPRLEEEVVHGQHVVLLEHLHHPDLADHFCCVDLGLGWEEYSVLYLAC